MHKIAIIGAGKIGGAIAKLLHKSGDYEVHVVDNNTDALSKLRAQVPVEVHRLNIDDQSFVDFLEGKERVLSAGPYTVNVAIAEAAAKVGVSYFDLTEDRYTTDKVREIAANAIVGQSFIPQCGLAPGFIGILAGDMSRQFDQLEEIKMRVGALPIYPSNKLLYNLTWSTDGLINEYSNPAESIVDGRKIDTISLEECETFVMDGTEYECFNTSGGLGTLCETLDGKVKNLNYKTVRYPGHCELMSFLIRDLKLGERRAILKDILDTAVPFSPQDVVLAFCTVKGLKNGRYTEVSDVYKVYNQKIHGEDWTGIQVTTAAGACAMIDLHAQGHFESGFIRQESVPLDTFLSNRFGSYYRTGK